MSEEVFYTVDETRTDVSDILESTEEVIGDNDYVEVESHTLEVIDSTKKKVSETVEGKIAIRMTARHWVYLRGDDVLVTKKELKGIPKKKYITL